MPRLDLFLVSGLILFLELACIRWLPAHVLFLSFFTNTVLLACFVGMSVGCLIARKPGRALDATPYWLLALLALGLLVNGMRGKLERYTDVGHQGRPEVVFFGTEANALKEVEFAVPVQAVAGLFFFLTAAATVGPGQQLGRAFNRIPNRTTAYALDLLGSLSGIGLFAGCSALQLPPVVWFGLVSVGLTYLLLRPAPDRPTGRMPWLPLAALAGVVAVTVPTSGLWAGREGERTFWSPYYRVDYVPKQGYIATNRIGHQTIHARGTPNTSHYDFPYLFRLATDRQPYRRVLIIGAGSGNDLARCLYWCPPDARIDAVEIEPAIQAIGEADHPDRPYQDPRVTLHLNDGRNFLRRAPDGEYDLVIFALIDSLVLHSGYSNLRLESYLFTREAFQDVARVLRPDGEAVVYNYFRQPWIMARIRNELRSAFAGAEPVVLADPPFPEERIEPDGGLYPGFTMFFAGREDVVAPLRRAFGENGNRFWVPGRVGVTHNLTGGFGEAPPSELPEPARVAASDRPEWVDVRAVRVEEAENLPPATDDWPFLYVRRAMIPGLTWQGIGLILLLSGALWWLFRHKSDDEPLPLGSGRDHSLLARAFLLGAGFMLVETRAVVQMALLFGSTWTVNTVVFAAVLVMALGGNLFARWVRPTNLTPYYLGLFFSLGANLLVSPDTFLGWEHWPQTIASSALVFAPILFAGVIFPVSFTRARFPDRFFGANVAGALVGGLAENLSMLLGFQLLLLVAFGFYGLSGLFGGLGFGTPDAERGV